MKILSQKTRQVYEISLNGSGENKMPCPECSKDRKKAKNKCFSFNAGTRIGYCNHCMTSFFEYVQQEQKKEYSIPVYTPSTNIDQNSVKWFTGRMISKQTLDRLQISNSKEYISQVAAERNCICFPYYRNGQVVNVKYRDGAKNFKLCKDAELIFYNLDSVKDHKECIVTEGEIDCLSFIEAGFEPVLSVPNGAGGKSMDYVTNCYEDLLHIEKFILATDQDPKGIELREELIRRLGPERCYSVDFKDCKDGNEYLVKYGSIELQDVVKNAQSVPIKDIIVLDSIYDSIYNLYQKGLQPGKTISVRQVDEFITWETGRLAVVTGIPSHGKSTFVDFLITRLNVLHGWKIGLFSPENCPVQVHVANISNVISGKSFNPKYLQQAEFEKTYCYIRENYFWIVPDEDISIQNILDKAKYLVRKQGIKVLVIDPFNKLEHQSDYGESETRYISRFLDKLSMFAKMNDVLVILVAHPKKMEKNKETGLFNRPSLYDISGSATFFDKPDYGLIVFRDFKTGLVTIDVSKVRFKHLGPGGECELVFNAINNRYEMNNDPMGYDSYLDAPVEKQELINFYEPKEQPF